MSFISKLFNTTVDDKGNTSIHIGGVTVGSNGKSMSDLEAPKIGDNTFGHNGKIYTRIGNSLFGSDGKSWASNDMDDDTVRGITNNDSKKSF